MKLITKTIILILLRFTAHGQEINLLSSVPAANTIDVEVDANVLLNFDQNIDQSTIDGSTPGSPVDDNIIVVGNISGIYVGTFTGDGTAAITFDPLDDFRPGEEITIIITDGVMGTTAGTMVPTTFQFSASTNPGPALPNFFDNDDSNIISSAAMNIRGVAVGDVDGDGDLDALSASGVDDKIAWYENDGNGVFVEQIVSFSADNPRSVTVGDLDGDGDLDVVSASGNDDKIAWYENDGGVDPAFTDHTISTNANSGRMVAVGDLDGDGDLDIASASEFDNKIAWYENDGNTDPTFTEFVISTQIIDAIGVAMGDLDGDGDLDIVSAARSYNLAWFENENVTFTERVISAGINSSWSNTIGDINGDGHLDIVFTEGLDDAVGWYENDGQADPSFEMKIASNVPNGPRGVDAADMDGDGDLDIVTAAYNDNNVYWHENSGGLNPTFTDYVIASEEDGATGVSVGDFDGDADLDVVVAIQFENRVTWYENTFRPFNLLSTSPANNAINADMDTPITFSYDVPVDQSTIDGGTPGNPQDDNILITGDQSGLITGQFSGDGSEEIIFTPDKGFFPGENISIAMTSQILGTAGEVLVPHNLQFTTTSTSGPSKPPFFIESNDRIVSNEADGASSVKMGDIDGDGDVDLISGSGFDNKIAWYENDGNPSPSFEEHIVGTDAPAVLETAIGDVDSDGDLDILSASWTNNKIAWYENNGESDPTFTEHPISTSADGAYSVVMGDFDRDGDQDVASASINDDKVSWYENDGDENFTERILGTDQDRALHVSKGDFDHDGDLDILALYSGANKIGWFKNDGEPDPSFELIDIGANIDIGLTVTTGDINGDGFIDILSASLDDDRIAWYENDGNPEPSFTQHDISNSADGGYSVSVADMDGDGDLDVLSTSIFDDKVAWYENNGATSPIFTEHLLTNNADEPYVVAHGDLDGDGDLDLATASFNDDKIAWYENIGTKSDVISLSFPQETGSGTIDNATREINIEVTAGSDVSSLSPDIEISPGATVSPQSGAFVDFTQPVTLTVTSEDASSILEWVVNVVAVPVSPELILESVGQTIVKVNWDMPGFTEAFQLEISSNQDFTDFLEGYPKIIAKTSLTEINSTLEAGTLYYSRIRSFNVNNTPSLYSDIVEILTIPDNPVATFAAAINNGSFTANWSEVKGADFYILEVSSDGFESLILKEEIQGQEFYIVTDLPADIQFEYRVKAGNNSGISDYSNIVNVTTLNNPVPLSLLVSNEVREIDLQERNIISIQTSGGIGDVEVSIRHKPILEEDFGIKETLIRDANNEYTFVVLPEFLDQLGVAYEVTAEDDVSTVIESGNIAISFSSSESPGIPINSFGGKKDTWNLFSIPYDLTDKTIQGIFENYDPGNYGSEWRIMRFRNANQDYVDFNAGQITIGEGYWFNAKIDQGIQVGEASVNTQIPFTITLDEGWNLIGNPYNVSISWSRTLAENDAQGVDNLQIFEGLEQLTTDILNPFEAGFVWSEELTEIEIYPHDIRSGRLSTQRKAQSDKFLNNQNWLLFFSLETEGHRYQVGGMGMHPEASDLKDSLDFLALPRFLVYNEIYTLKNDYSYPWFSVDVVKERSNYHWDFTVASNIANERTQLRWNNEILKTSEADWYIFDKVNAFLINMKELDYFSIDLSDGEFDFEVYFTSDGTIPIPEEIILGNAYPNPVSDHVNIPFTIPSSDGGKFASVDILDLHGKLLHSVRQESVAPGFHSWPLDLPLYPNGIYIYRLTLGNSSWQKKIVVNK